MAVKWAVANGNWSAGATWNDGVVPASGDDVYANGHVITCNVAISVKTLTNAVCPNTNIGGGHFTRAIANNEMIRGNLIQYGGEALLILSTASGRIHYIVGNIVNDSGYALQITSSGWGYTLNITGNITTGSRTAIYSRSNSGDIHIDAINVIGNVSGNYALANAPRIARVSVVGNCNCAPIDSDQTLGSLIVSGDLSYLANFIANNANIGGSIFADNSVMDCTTLTINGSITYKSTDNTMGVRYTTLNILNPNTFTWKDISEPRSNPFIILTDAEMNNRQQYPSEDVVKEGVEYVWGEKIGTYQQPPEAVVLRGFVYDNGDKVGSLENQNIVGCVTKEDVREGVELIGLQEVGTLVVPDVDDVREGVVFDNGSVGTLIVQGGGDRLRIADFGYYTRSTSITYIVDLTESDKPAFADCEEIVLRSLFPTLDLDNIPDKYFDDLFVQFLRYRLLVEYYRGTSINSKFTPSEPTAEIVNYANTKCEYWLNTANLFLQLWGEKYPNSVKKDRILL